jgi:transposase
MITVPAGIRVLVATKPVDFRRGDDSLAALVREQLKHDPFSGTIFIFRSKRSDPPQDPGLGRDRSGAVLEAAGARGVPVAADQRRRDAALSVATCRTCRRIGLGAAACGGCPSIHGDVVSAVAN